MAPIIQLSPEMSAAQQILSGGNPLAGLVPENPTPPYAGPIPVSGGPASAPAPAFGQSALATPEEPKIGVSEGFGQQMARIADQISTKNPGPRQPGDWARQLVGAAQGALAGLGDVSTTPGGGALAGISQTLANRNNRIAQQKQQDFNNQRALNTEQREKERNDATIAHMNLEDYHTQVLTHIALEDEESKVHNVQQGLKDYQAFTSGDVPANTVKKGVSADEMNKLMQEGKINGHEYTSFPVDQREVGKDPKTGQPQFETLYNVTEVPKRFKWTEETAAEVNKYAPTGEKIIPGTETSGADALFLTKRARSNEAVQLTINASRRRDGLEELQFENEEEKAKHLAEIRALQPDLTNVLAKTKGDQFRAAREFATNPELLKKYPNGVQDVMDIYGGPKEWETARHNREDEAIKWANSKQEQALLQDQNYVFTNDQLAQIAALPADRRNKLESFPKAQQDTILQLGTNAGDLSFKETALRQAKGLNAMTAQQLSAAVTSIFPQWNEQRHDVLLKMRKDITTGPTHEVVDHYNQFLGHAAKLQDIITELGRTHQPLYNTALNAVQTQLGQQDAAKLRAAINPVEHEWAEFMKDGKAASIAEQNGIRNLFPENANVGQMVTALKQAATTGVIRLAPHDADYRKADGPNSAGLPGLLTEDGAHALVHLDPDDQTKRQAGKFNVGGTLWDDANAKKTKFEDVQKDDTDAYAKQQAEKMHTQPQSLALQNAPPGAAADTQWRVSPDGKTFIYLMNNQWVDSKGNPVK